MTDDHAVKAARAWLLTLGRRDLTQQERRALHEAGRHHVEQLIKAYAELYADYQKVWRVEHQGRPSWAPPSSNDFDAEPTVDLATDDIDTRDTSDIKQPTE